jgi:hypothetical protein
MAMAMPMLPMARWQGGDITIAMAMSMAIAIPLLPIQTSHQSVSLVT